MAHYTGDEGWRSPGFEFAGKVGVLAEADPAGSLEGAVTLSGSGEWGDLTLDGELRPAGPKVVEGYGFTHEEWMRLDKSLEVSIEEPNPQHFEGNGQQASSPLLSYDLPFRASVRLSPELEEVLVRRGRPFRVNVKVEIKAEAVADRCQDAGSHWWLFDVDCDEEGQVSVRPGKQAAT